jgi:hypothetical protein
VIFLFSVAEPELEPVEQQLFAGAGYINSYTVKCYKTPKFFIQKFEVDFKNHNFIAI